jgi:hypothetical protein
MAARITKGYWIWGQFDIATTNDIIALYEKIKQKLNGRASKPVISISSL